MKHHVHFCERCLSSACFSKAQGKLQKSIKTSDEGRDAGEWKEHAAVRKLQEPADGPMEDSFRLRVVDKEVGSAEAGPKRELDSNNVRACAMRVFNRGCQVGRKGNGSIFVFEEKTMGRSSLKN